MSLMDGILLKLFDLQHIFLPKHYLQVRNLRENPHVFWQCFLLGTHSAVTACARGMLENVFTQVQEMLV